MQNEDREQSKLKSLEKIFEETDKFEQKKKEKVAVQVQVRMMREQLAIKKKRMIDELRELRKEYKL